MAEPGPRQVAIQNLIRLSFSGLMIIAIKFVGSDGATSEASSSQLPLNAPVAFGTFADYPGGGGEMTNVEPGDNAKAFFAKHKKDFTKKSSVAFFANAGLFGYFLQVPSSLANFEVRVDMSSCFPFNHGSITSAYKLFRKPPPDEENDGYTFEELLNAEATNKGDAPGVSIVSNNRWNKIKFKFKTSPPPGTVLDPPNVEWIA